MSMMGMTATLIFVYFTAVWVILSWLHKINHKYVNATFVILNVAFFLALKVVATLSWLQRFYIFSFDFLQ